MKSAIGGYFELEISPRVCYHPNAIAVNTGRNAFEYILTAKGFTRVYLPEYFCLALLEPIRKLGLDCRAYALDQFLNPVFDYEQLQEGDAFLYTDFFGLKANQVRVLSGLEQNLIVDNAHAFFARPLPGINTFYSPRKFFGVPDGGYVYCNSQLPFELQKDESATRCQHLLKRLDTGAETGYADFLRNEAELNNQPLLAMSALTAKLLHAIDYDWVEKRRQRNFALLHQLLGMYNEFCFDFDQDCVPLVYPFLQNRKGLREKLIQKKMYTATYWPNIVDKGRKESIGYKLAAQAVFLPIDQRLDEEDIERISEVYLNEG